MKLETGRLNLDCFAQKGDSEKREKIYGYSAYDRI